MADQPTMPVTTGHSNADPENPKGIYVVQFFTGIVTMGFIIFLTLFVEEPQFSLKTLSLTNFRTTSYSQISGDWVVDFISQNPSPKFNLYYDEIKVSLLYKNDPIAKTSVAPFVQGAKNETRIRAAFASMTAYVDDVDSINEERRLHGSITFGVRMMVRVHSTVSMFGMWDLIVDCSGLKIPFSLDRNGGTLIGDSKKCTAFSA